MFRLDIQFSQVKKVLDLLKMVEIQELKDLEQNVETVNMF